MLSSPALWNTGDLHKRQQKKEEMLRANYYTSIIKNLLPPCCRATSSPVMFCVQTRESKERILERYVIAGVCLLCSRQKFRKVPGARLWDTCCLFIPEI